MPLATALHACPRRTGETRCNKMEKEGTSDKKKQELVLAIVFFFSFDLTENKVPNL